MGFEIKKLKKIASKSVDTLQFNDKLNENIVVGVDEKEGYYIDSKKPSYYKKHFNDFFHNDLYGKYRSDENIILSTGALNQDEFCLPRSLKFAISYALTRNWYGYSCSLGRESARLAIADLENHKINSNIYNENNVALIQGVTAGLFHLLSFLKEREEDGNFGILTHYPTYVPFAATCEKIAPTKIINFFGDKKFSIEAFKRNIDKTTKVILLLGDFNPLGKLMDVSFVNELIDICDEKSIYLIIDEAGSKYPENNWNNLKNSDFLIRMDSLSKKVSVPGMKLGYFIANEEIISEFYERASTTYGGPSSFFYILQELDARFDLFFRKGLLKIGSGELALFDKNYNLGLFFLNILYGQYIKNKHFFELKIKQHRSIVIDKLISHHPQLVKKIIMPETGINIFLQLDVDYGSYEFFRKLIVEKRTAVFPGLCSATDKECWIRITCGVDKKTLQTGLDNLVDFLKTEWIKKQIQKEPFFEKLLLDFGQYGSYGYLSFFEHIYDVQKNGMKILDIFELKTRRKLDRDLLREVIFCHDAGKVVSVIVFRIMRILQLQKKYGKIPFSVFSKLRDEDLLFLRKEIVDCFVFTKEYFYEMFPFLHDYSELMNLDSDKYLKDTVFTEKMLQLALDKYPNYEKKIEEMKFIILNNSAKININNLMIGYNPYIFILDFADKIADYNLPEEPTLAKIDELLRKKKKYVIKRYCHNNRSMEAIVHCEFSHLYELIRESRVFHKC